MSYQKKLNQYQKTKFSVFNEAKYFPSRIFQNYVMFIPDKKCMKYFNGTNQIYSWKSNEMLEESIENITKSNSLFAPTFANCHILPDVNFNGHCLINNKISILEKVINIYISYILNQWPRDLNTDFTLDTCLFGSVKLTKNPGPDKYKYSGCDIGFDRRSEFSLPNGSMGKMSLFLELI